MKGPFVTIASKRFKVAKQYGGGDDNPSKKISGELRRAAKKRIRLRHK
jgi:hypothetical protein